MNDEPVATVTIRFEAGRGYPDASVVNWAEYVAAAIKHYSAAGTPPPMYAKAVITDVRLIKKQRG